MKIWLFLLVFFFSFQSAIAEPYDYIEVIVGNSVITKNEIDLFASREAGFQKLSFETEEEKEKFRTKVRKDLIQSHLLLNKAEQLGITISASQINNMVDKIMKDRQLDQDGLSELLAAQSMTLTSFKRSQKEKSIQNRILDMEVRSKVQKLLNEEDLKVLYEQEDAGEILIKARHILRRVPKGASKEEEEKARKAIIFIRDKILQGEDFTKMVYDYSEDPSKKTNQGVIGPFKRKDIMAEFSNVAFELQPFVLSDPVRTSFGYHLIEVLERVKEKKKPFEEMKKELQKQQYSKIFKEQLDIYLKQLKKEIKIQYPKQNS